MLVSEGSSPRSFRGFYWPYWCWHGFNGFGDATHHQHVHLSHKPSWYDRSNCMS